MSVGYNAVCPKKTTSTASDMDFPSLGDAQQYHDLAQTCARQILEGNGLDCYHPYRPIGIILYYTLPMLASSDPVSVAYMTLAMNLLCLAVILACGSLILREFYAAEVPAYASGRFASEVVYLVLAVAMSVGFVPVRLSDHQSFAFFIAGFTILYLARTRQRPLMLVLAGVMAGSAVLFKQNYAVAIALLMAIWAAVELPRKGRSMLLPMCCFCVGASVCLLQIGWVYYHSGVPWLYEPAAMEFFASSNRQPVVELVAHTQPERGAYQPYLDRRVSEFEYFAVKFYHGLTKLYWAVYSGHAPLEKTPRVLEYSPAEIMGMQWIYVVMGLISFASLRLREKWLSILVLTAFLTATVTTALAHVESRFFYFPRFVFLIYVLVVFGKALDWCRGRLVIAGRAML